MNVYDVESLKIESDEGTTASVNTVAAIEVGATVPVETDTVVIGMAGPQGPPGDPGAGVPSGGTAGQVLGKASAADHDTTWVDQSGSGFGWTFYSASEPTTENVASINISLPLNFSLFRITLLDIQSANSGAGDAALLARCNNDDAANYWTHQGSTPATSMTLGSLPGSQIADNGASIVTILLHRAERLGAMLSSVAASAKPRWTNGQAQNQAGAWIPTASPATELNLFLDIGSIFPGARVIVEVFNDA